jgi:hypothetical protein
MNAADRWAAANWEPMLSERSAEIHRFLAVLDKEQHIQAAQQHGVDMEEVGGQDGLRLASRNARQDCPARCGAGSMPASLRICHTVDGASLHPRPASSPWMRR